MKVIFFGLGSIGKRHLDNLITLCRENNMELEVHGFRSGVSKEDITGLDKCLFNIEEIDAHYDAAFITNPTALHYETLNLMKSRSDYIFVEKPVFECPTYQVDEQIDVHHVYVAAPLRYKPIMQSLKQYIADKRIYSVRVICSTYLPSWREGDYRKSYSASGALGGGVELDCIHELDYVTWLFGFPIKNKKLLLQKSNLSIESNDLALYLFEYTDKAVEIHLDYFGVYPQRKIEILTTDDRIVCDLLNDTLYSQQHGMIADMKRDRNEMYMEELRYFIGQVMHESSNWNDLGNALEVLKLAKGEDIT